MAKSVAVVLAGCGVMDGSEIHEAVSVLIHLDRHGFSYQCFAPDAAQTHVVNHAAGQPAEGEQRNMLTEAARLARGKIKPLSELHARDFSAVVFPGGFGAAKNLCDFAFKGAAYTVRPDVERVVKDFHGARKPIGMCCIAPVIAARVLGKSAGGPGCRVTIGEDPGVAAAITAAGSQHVNAPVSASVIDEPNRLITTPAYMYEVGPAAVFAGIGTMIDSLAAQLTP